MAVHKSAAKMLVMRAVLLRVRLRRTLDRVRRDWNHSHPQLRTLPARLAHPVPTERGRVVRLVVVGGMEHILRRKWHDRREQVTKNRQREKWSLPDELGRPRLCRAKIRDRMTMHLSSSRCFLSRSGVRFRACDIFG